MEGLHHGAEEDVGYVHILLEDREIMFYCSTLDQSNEIKKLFLSIKQEKVLNQIPEENYEFTMRNRGMKNNGNTCYQNAVLVALLNIPKFVYATEKATPQSEVRRSLCKMIKEWHTQKTILDPGEFSRIVWQKTKKFSIGLQEDAHEFFIEILELLDSESGQVSSLFTTQEELELKCLKCKQISKLKESNLGLSVEVRRGGGMSVVMEYFSTEKIEYNCNCGGTAALITRTLLRGPEILVLHLKRFKIDSSTYKVTKNLSFVRIPENLSIFDESFELKSIVSHSGDEPIMGHYVADVKVGELWATYDDHKVSQMDYNEMQKIRKESTYLCFFEKIIK